MGLTKDSILKADDQRLEPVQVPEWGGTVYVTSMTLAELRDLQKHAGDPNDSRSLAEMVVRVVRDDDGERVFSDGDAEAVSGKSFRALSRIVATFNRINGLTDDEDEAGKK